VVILPQRRCEKNAIRGAASVSSFVRICRHGWADNRMGRQPDGPATDRPGGFLLFVRTGEEAPARQKAGGAGQGGNRGGKAEPAMGKQTSPTEVLSQVRAVVSTALPAAARPAEDSGRIFGNMPPKEPAGRVGARRRRRQMSGAGSGHHPPGFITSKRWNLSPDESAAMVPFVDRAFLHRHACK